MARTNEPNVLSLTFDVTHTVCDYKSNLYEDKKTKITIQKKSIHLLSALIRNCPSSPHTYMNKSGKENCSKVRISYNNNKKTW